MAAGQTREKWGVFVFCPDCAEEVEVIVDEIDAIDEAQLCPCGSGFVTYRIAEHRDG